MRLQSLNVLASVLIAKSLSGVEGFVPTRHNFPTVISFRNLNEIYECKSDRCQGRNVEQTLLFVVETTPSDEDQFRDGPIETLVEDVKGMDVNAIINTAAIVIVILAVLGQVAFIDTQIMRGWSAEEVAVRIPVDNWYSYSAVLEKSPLYTKAVTSATVYTIGDFIAQRTEGVSMGGLDRSRILRSLLAGLIGHGPLSHLWFDFSENIFENVLHLKDWWGTIAKVGIDQTTWGPFWNNTYILLLGLMKFDSIDNIFSEMKRTTIPLIVSGLKLWPLAHIITYGLIPVENRLLWVDLVEIIWVTILASAAADSGNEGGLHGSSDDLPEKEMPI